MIKSFNDFGEEVHHSSVCCICKKILDERWINYVPLGDFCINCAQRVMRVMLQDIIGYHNDGKEISLLNIMYYGDKEGDFFNPGPNGKRDFEAAEKEYERLLALKELRSNKESD